MRKWKEVICWRCGGLRHIKRDKLVHSEENDYNGHYEKVSERCWACHGLGIIREESGEE